MIRALTACLLVTLAFASPAHAAAPANARQDYQAADKELNTIYKTLTTTIEWGPSIKKKLVQSELTWIRYRDSEGELARAMAEVEPEAARWRRMAELTRERMRLLTGFIDQANAD